MTRGEADTALRMLRLSLLCEQAAGNRRCGWVPMKGGYSALYHPFVNDLVLVKVRRG